MLESPQEHGYAARSGDHNQGVGFERSKALSACGWRDRELSTGSRLARLQYAGCPRAAHYYEGIY
jgi:hypothetical protein